MKRAVKDTHAQISIRMFENVLWTLSRRRMDSTQNLLQMSGLITVYRKGTPRETTHSWQKQVWAILGIAEGVG